MLPLNSLCIQQVGISVLPSRRRHYTAGCSAIAITKRVKKQAFRPRPSIGAGQRLQLPPRMLQRRQLPLI